MSKASTDRGPGSPKSAGELLDMFFLDMRCALLETAAALDRIDLASGSAEISADPRLVKIKEACALLVNGSGNRAAQFLRLFSDPVP